MSTYIKCVAYIIVNFILRLPSCNFISFVKQFHFKMSVKQRFIYHFLRIYVESKHRINHRFNDVYSG